MIHFIDLSLNPSFELVEQFAASVEKEDGLTEDDKGRWGIERIKKYHFDHCLYTTVDDVIVNMTFNKWYGDFLRIGVNCYTLKKFRSHVFRPIWKAGGYMDKTHEHSGDRARGYFCTYYAKNKKIASVIKMLMKTKDNRSLSFGGEPPGWLSRFSILSEEPITFRYVPQYISYANNIGEEANNYQRLIKQLA